VNESGQMSEPTASASTAVPLAPLPDDVAARLRQTGAQQVNLYRALAHAPRLLEAWIDFAWALRERCDTPRTLRELMILRTAQRMLSQYEWHQHRRMAAEARIELTLTASFYCAVPRLLDALRVPVETAPSPAASDD
jgi:alkylhydroperoxidase family enzyme